jgi:hypothetical protein
MDSWLYDRVTGVVILNLERGHHESFSSILQKLYTAAPLGFSTMKQDERDAERFLEEGHGFLLSSRGRRPLKGESIRLTAQEKAVFSSYEFRSI